jgi:hypothetical protein
MNIINAGNPSANNMITRQVMQKKRESSATIFDKLNKRTAELTAKNPLNNILTNDQLFRYYIKEVEPRLSQSNDNFQGLPNTTPQTPPDNSIKDTVEKSFGNGRDEYNAGFSGNGVEGILNSNDINSMTSVRLSDPQIGPVFDPNDTFNPTEFDAYINTLHVSQARIALQNLYDNNKKHFDLLVEMLLKKDGLEVNDLNRQKVLHGLILNGFIHDDYQNVYETRYTDRIEEVDKIRQFLATGINNDDYHSETAIMLNVIISTYSGHSGLDTSKFFFNLWNEFYGQTTLDRAIEEIYDIWTKSEGTPLQDAITTSFNRIFEKTDIDSFNLAEFRDLVWNYVHRHTSYAQMPVRKFKTELAKYTLDKMTPDQACLQQIDYWQEELTQSRKLHARQVQYLRARDPNIQQDLEEYEDDGFGNLIQVKDPSTHPSKPQELKIATTVAPVSAQSVKNDAVISRGRAPPTPRELEGSSKSKNKYK